jgi:chromosome segregation ATPase
MARHPKPSAEQVPVVLKTEVLAADAAAATEVTVAEMAVLESAELFKTIGRLETAHFYEAVSSKIIIDSYTRAKELFSKIKELPYIDGQGRAKRVSSLEEFCEVCLGRTQRRCQQLAKEMALMGPELYERAEAVGFRSRDYQALAALPADAREAVKQALASDDKESARDLLFDLAGRANAVQRELADAQQTITAKDKLLEKKDKRINALEEQLDAPWQPDEDTAAATAEQQRMLDAVREHVVAAELSLVQLANVASEIFDTAELPEAAGAYARQSIEYLAQRIGALANSHGITIDMDALAPAPWEEKARAKAAGRKAKA